MIVECEACHKKFNLDESLVKEGGIKVRCSLCKHTFFVYPPDEPSSGPEEGALVDEGGHEELSSFDFLEKTGIEDSGMDKEPDSSDSEPERVFPESLEEYEATATLTPEDLFDFDEERKPREESQMEREEILEPEERSYAAPRPKRSARPRVLPIVLLVFALVAVGAAAAVIWAPELLPDSLSALKAPTSSSVPDPGVSRLMVSSVKGYFIDSEKAGQLFIVRGKTTNNYPEARSFIRLEGCILDTKGKVVRKKLVYAGNIFPDEVIKQKPIKEIDSSMQNRFGMDKRNFNVSPGTSVPFLFVFEDLPENISEYTVEKLSSSPGT